MTRPIRIMRSLKGLSLGMIAASLAWGCAAQARSPRACEPVPTAFSLPDQVVYPECGVDRKARRTVYPRGVTYTPSPGQTCARAAIEVVVDSAGLLRPETARVAQTNDPGYAAAVINSLGGYRFDPALKDGRPVAQLVRIDHAIVATRAVVPAGMSPQSVRRPPRRPPC